VAAFVLRLALRSLPVIILAGFLAAAAAVEAGPAAYVLSNNSLISIDAASPGSAGAPVAVTGLNAGDTLVGIDFRPQNGFLYGLGFNSAAGSVTVYHVSHRTGQATPVGPAAFFTTPVLGTSFGFDFNPTVDRIRVVTSAGQNFRLNPNTGEPVDGIPGPGVDMDGIISGATTTVDAAAYTNNEQNAAVTTLYTLSAASNQLFIQNPPNNGTQTVPVNVTLNGSPLDFTAANGFDILPGVNVAANNAVAAGVGFAALTVGGVSSLYTIDLTTGAASLVGLIGNGTVPIQGLAVQGNAVPGGIPAIALTDLGTSLARFNTGSANTAALAVVTGLVMGEVLVGIDWRPQTGQLFGLGVNPVADTGTLYRLDPQTGVATIVGMAGLVTFPMVDLPAAGVGYGFDFNPTVDRIRVVTNTGLNFRVNPNTGAPAGLDTAINGLPGGSTGVTGAAYTNSFGQSLIGGVTTQYVLDPASNTLFIQNPPNGGVLTMGLPISLNGAPLDFDAVNGFDIPGRVQVAALGSQAFGRAYAALTVGGQTDLYSIALSTGAATLIGPVGAALDLGGLALGEPGVTTLTFGDVSGNFAQAFIADLAAAGLTGGCATNPPLFCPDAPVTREQMAAFIMRGLGEFAPPAPATQRFADVPATNPFYAFIDRLAALGITLGCGGGNYCPTAPVTREQMAAFIIRALGEPNPPAPGMPRFADVPPTHPFFAFIDRLAARGITAGCSSTNYCPADPVTRAQMAVFLVRAFNL
jgi:hypothetical protein